MQKITKTTLTVKKLKKENINDIIQLQDNIIANLHPDEQHFILHRTKEDYLKTINSSSSHILGIYNKEELIAQTVYCLPQDNESRDMPEFKSNDNNKDLVLYEAILVNPTYRGSSLMKQMLDSIELIAQENNRKTSIIQIAVDNPASWINALRHGMSITKVDNDPFDGVQVVYLEKKIQDTEYERSIHQENLPTYSLKLGDDIHHKIPQLFNKMKQLVNSGYIATKLDKETKSLVWKQISTPRSNFDELAIINKLKTQRV